MKNKGFTLAEVLITLAIIGVIAAISVPSLIQKTNQAELITAWKKQFAMISQGVGKMTFDNGNLNGAFKTEDEFFNQFKNYFKIIKTCKSTETTNCWYPTMQYLNGGSTPSDGYSSVILNDGSIWRVRTRNNPCDESTTECINLHIDVNGHKNPNTAGKDVFSLMIYSDGNVAPYDGTCKPGDTTDVTNTGYGCAALYLYSK